MDTAAAARRHLLLTTLLAGALYAEFIWRNSFMVGGLRYFSLFDDAMICLRYARHFAAGLGLTWNPADVPPVEGYSNFLWVCVMALLHVIGLPVNLVAGAVSGVALLLLLCNLQLVYRLVRELSGSTSWGLGGAALAAFYYPTVYWSLRGMEVALLGFFLLAAAWAALRLLRDEVVPARAAVLLALSCCGLLLTRDETLLLVGVLLVQLALQPRLRTTVLRIGGAALVVKAAHLLWRHGYYGEWVPNTYYLKIYGSHLASRVSTAASDLQCIVYSLAPALACALWAGAAVRDERDRQMIRLLQSLVLVYAAYSVYVGEDAWLIDFSNRYWATLAPLLWTLAALGLKALCQQPLTRRRVLSLAAALLLQLLLWLHAGFAPWSRTLVLSMAGAGALAGLVAVLARSARWQLPAAVGLLLYAASGPAWYHAYDFAPMFTVDDESFVKQGLFLKQVLPPDTRVATAWIGAPAYFSDLYFIDIEGKVDPHVAHIQGSEPFRAGFTKRDPAWSVGRLKPDVLLYRSPQWGCYGYTPLSNDLCVRPDRLPALAALAGNWCDEHDRSRYCP